MNETEKTDWNKNALDYGRRTKVMDEIENYWRNNWRPNYEKYTYSGYELLRRVDKNANILDIGCGYNLLKRYFPNLYGIDPYNSYADEEVSWLDYVQHKDFEHYLILGSINHGHLSDIIPQIEKLADMTKSGDTVYWRQNPGLSDHKWEGVEVLRFFEWSEDINKDFCDKYNFELQCFKQDTGDRYYAEWRKN